MPSKIFKKPWGLILARVQLWVDAKPRLNEREKKMLGTGSKTNKSIRLHHKC